MTNDSGFDKQPFPRRIMRSRPAMIVATIMLSLVPFVVVEGLVRVFASPPAVVDVNPIKSLEHLRPLFELDDATDRYKIPDWRLTFFCRQSFSRIKSPGTRRVFVLGGSTVQGRPFATETAFSTWLKLRLEAADPDARFEVVNCGGVSYASYRVAKIMEEVIAYQPDAIVIYTGHNEFLEDRTYAAVRELGPVRRAITRVTSAWATAQWIRGKLATPNEPASIEPVAVWSLCGGEYPVGSSRRVGRLPLRPRLATRSGNSI